MTILNFHYSAGLNDFRENKQNKNKNKNKKRTKQKDKTKTNKQINEEIKLFN